MRANTTWPLHKETRVLTELEPHKHTSPYIIPCKRVYLPRHQQFSAQGCRSGSKIKKREKFKSTREIARDLRSWPALPEDPHGCSQLSLTPVLEDSISSGFFGYPHMRHILIQTHTIQKIEINLLKGWERRVIVADKTWLGAAQWNHIHVSHLLINIQ